MCMYDKCVENDVFNDEIDRTRNIKRKKLEEASKKMRIAVCDDSEIDRELITDLLNRYFSDKSFVYQIERYSSGKDLVYDVEEGEKYNIVFLDIYMDGILGIDAARRLRDLRYDGAIVFLTSTPAFAVASYDVMADGYLLKPHSFQKLCMVMDRILTNYTIDTYQVKFRNKIIQIPFNEIMYVESSNTKCILHRNNGETYTVYRRLDEIESELNDKRFLRCHQSYIVNMAYIYSVDTKFTLFSGDIVMIRRRELTQIKQRYLDYAQKTSHEYIEQN